jgi:hypothetical protein
VRWLVGIDGAQLGEALGEAVHAHELGEWIAFAADDPGAESVEKLVTARS